MKKSIDKKKLLKYTGLTLMFVVGTSIIVLACMVLSTLFFSGKVQGRGLSKNLSDFSALYDDNQSIRDLPEGINIVDSFCEISEDKKSFSYSLILENTAKSKKSYSLQVYCPQEYVIEYGDRVVNPIILEPESLGSTIERGEKKTFTYKGIVFGEGQQAIDTLKEKMQYVCFEIIYGADLGRIMVPVRFV